MDSDTILKQILINFTAKGYSQVPGYNRFGYIGQTDSAVIVSRETGQDTKIPFAKILMGIEAVKQKRSVYDAGPASLRDFEITHINSPIWSLLHMVPKSDY